MEVKQTMNKILKRAGIVVLIITFPIWIFPFMFVALGLRILDEVFDITWN